MATATFNAPAPSTRRNATIAIVIILGSAVAGIAGYLIYQNNQPAQDGTKEEIDRSPLSPPVLSVSSNSLSMPPCSVSLSYTAVEGASRYRIYRSSKQFSEPSNSLLIGTKYQLSLTDTITTAGTFYYAVSAVVDEKETALSARQTVTVSSTPPPPGSPVLQGAEQTSFDPPYGIRLTWTIPPGATSFSIYAKSVSFTNADKSSATKVTSTSPTYEDHVTSTGTYFYGVTATTTSGEGTLSNVVSISIIQTKPELKSLQQSSTSSPYDVVVAYGSIAGATGYKIYRSGTDFSSKAEASVVAATSLLVYTDHQVVTTGIYFYAVTAIVAGTESGLSNRMSLTVIDGTPPPSSPALQTLAKTSATPPYNVEATYTDVPGASLFKLYRAGTAFASTSSAVLVKTSTTLKCIDPIMDTGIFWYGVTAVVSGVESQLSNVKSITVTAGTPTLPPDSPVLSEAQASGYDAPFNVLLQYSKPPGTTSFKIYQASSAFTNTNKYVATIVATPDGSDMAYSLGVSNPGTYYFGVTASNANGEGALSNVVSINLVSSKLDRPTIVIDTLTIGTSGAYHHYDGKILTVDGATSYKIYYMETPFTDIQPWMGPPIKEVFLSAPGGIVVPITFTAPFAWYYIGVVATSIDGSHTDSVLSNVVSPAQTIYT